MIKILKKREVKKRLEVLKDLQGRPYKFYRGKSYNHISATGCFFCSCFDVAKSYRLYDETPIIEAEILVKNLVIIDATNKGRYSNYDRLNVCQCKIYPEDKRSDLLRYVKTVNVKNMLSTDEIRQWAMKTKDVDAVIVKNVLEGNNLVFPIYDVIVWNEKNLINVRNVVTAEDEFEDFRKNTFKRVDLSAYIEENERDGIASIEENEEYFIENIIKRNSKDWYIEPVLVVNINVPIEIYCIDIEKYVTAEQIDFGVYQNTAGVTCGKKFVPHNGSVRIKGLEPTWKYKIVK